MKGILGYNAVKWGELEYPLLGQEKLCPTARYVGGVSGYLCECQHPMDCEGVKAAIKGVEELIRKDKENG